MGGDEIARYEGEPGCVSARSLQPITASDHAIRLDTEIVESRDRIVSMKVRGIIGLIEADGWYRIKSRGGHRQYKHPVRHGRVTVPGQMNADLDKKTERSILMQAGLGA